MVAERRGGVDVVASMRACRLLPEPEMRTRRVGGAIVVGGGYSEGMERVLFGGWVSLGGGEVLRTRGRW